MFTSKDLEYKSIYVINCMNGRSVRVSNGVLLIVDTENGKSLTKIPFQKVLCLFFIGPTSITTPLIEKCREYKIAIVATKINLRPVFSFMPAAEANFMIRKCQYSLPENDLTPAKALIRNKVANQLSLLCRLRGRSSNILQSTKLLCQSTLDSINNVDSGEQLLSMEGRVAKNFFMSYFGKFLWKGRKPRAKADYLNAVLDIGYSILFNFVDCFVGMFGFDPYIGVFHKMWFRRKSLVCDIMEPFRCIVDNTIRNTLVKGTIKSDDFECVDGRWQLRKGKVMDYYRIFFDALVPYKNDVFRFVHDYYYAFLKGKKISDYPQFKI